MSLLDVTGLTIRYGDDTVVDGVDLYIERGESVGLVGESGSGKSQSALAILGLLPPQAEVSGSVTFDGEQLLGMDDCRLNYVLLPIRAKPSMAEKRSGLAYRMFSGLWKRTPVPLARMLGPAIFKRLPV